MNYKMDDIVSYFIKILTNFRKKILKEIKNLSLKNRSKFYYYE